MPEEAREALTEEETDQGGADTEKPGRSARFAAAGLLLFFGAFALLFFNERRAVRFYHAIGVGEGAVVSVRMDRIDPANDGKLVHVTGLAATGEILTDPVYGISANAIRLRRVIRFYHAPERNAAEDGGDQEIDEPGAGPAPGNWSEAPVRIDRALPSVGTEGTSALPFSPWETEARQVTLGAFFLPPPLVKQLDRFRPLMLSGTDREKMPPEIRYQAILDRGELFFGADPQSPENGDIRVGFAIAEPTTVTVVAQQKGNTFRPYPSESGPLMLLRPGAHSAEGILRKAPEENLLVTWGLRGLGLALMCCGFRLLLKNPVNAFLTALALSFMTIAVAWFVARPFLAVMLLTAAVAVLAGLRMLPGAPEPDSTDSGK